MTDPTPLRRDLPGPVLAAVRTISRPVWSEPYRPGRGPAHYASGPHWPAELRRLADLWERRAAAARVVAEFMEPTPESVTPSNDAIRAESVTQSDDTSPCG